LKIYFPQILHWFEHLDSELVCALLERWPTLEELQKVPPAKLRRSGVRRLTIPSFATLENLISAGLPDTKAVDRRRDLFPGQKKDGHGSKIRSFIVGIIRASSPSICSCIRGRIVAANVSSTVNRSYADC
jgi:hypothetical protein